MRNSSTTWYKIKDRPNLEKSYTLLRTASGTIIPHKGTTMVKMSVGEKTTSAKVFVITTKSTPLLELNTSVALGLQKGDNVQCDKCNSKAKDAMYESNINKEQMLNMCNSQEGQVTMCNMLVQSKNCCNSKQRKEQTQEAAIRL